MTHRPIIGISGSYITDKQQILVKETYTSAILQAGGLPVLLPTVKDESYIDAMLDSIDGLLLTGGGDVDPGCYGDARIPECGEPTPLRDAFELSITRKARARRMPIFGICRGVQILCVACGGKLFQDIPSAMDMPRERHYQDEPYSRLHHEVQLVKGGLLNRITQMECIKTNSMHHQAIRVIGSSLVVDAVSAEGVTEAVYDTQNEAIFGVQFHPEYITHELESGAKAMFEYFIQKVNAYRGEKIDN